MSLMLRWRFAWTQLQREWQAGELTILMLALLIAIASHTAIGFFTDRISRAMEFKARDMIGGDLVLTSPRPITEAWLQQATQSGLNTAQTQQFSSVVSSADGMLLVAAKSVSEAYPLKGSLKISETLFGLDHETTSGPKRGEAWVEPRVMSALQLTIGDSLELGSIELPVTRILTFEPDRGGNFYSFTPRVMIHQADLSRTEIVQPGSRVEYQYLFAGTDENIARFTQWLQPQLTPSHKLHGLADERPAVGNALDKAQQYMSLASLVALLLAAVAVAVTGRHYSTRHFDTSALLRCLGCQQRDILFIYLIQLSLLALIGGLVGNLFGWLTQMILLALVTDLLPAQIPTTSLAPFWSGMILSFVVLLGFTMPSIMRLKAVPPQRVLRKDLTPLPNSARLVYALSLTSIAGLMWFYTDNLRLTLSVITGSMLIFALASILIRLLFILLEKSLPFMPVSLRAGLRNFLRRRSEAVGQTMAFSLTLMAMLVVIFLRTELISKWQDTIPDDAPNHFVVNVLPAERDSFSNFLNERHIVSGQLYPVVRGRLTRINDKPVRDHVSKEEQNTDSLNRELNLTWSTELQEDNEIISGRWWDEIESTGMPGVSIESKLAKRLNIIMGDQLTFFTGDSDWSANVTSIRTVKWDSFHPNFYMIFAPGTLDELPMTYMTSFYLAPEEKTLLGPMIKDFPAITVLEMDAILSQVKGIITQAMLAIEAILLFVLAAGLSITLATIKASMDHRLRESALMRTLGADRSLIMRSNWSEFAGMGLIAGVLAVSGAELINLMMYQRIFQLSFEPTWWAWLLVPLLSAALIGSAGVFSSRKTVTNSPMSVLREL